MRLPAGWSIAGAQLVRPGGEALAPDAPVTAAEVEVLLGIPTETTLWFNQEGTMPARAVVEEARRRGVTPRWVASGGNLIDPGGTTFGPADLVSAAQAAEALGTTRDYVGVMIRRGGIQARQVGGVYVIPAAEVIRKMTEKG